MAKLLYQNDSNQLVSQSIASYNEKKPMHYYTKLPPTPSSSTLSLRLNEKDDTTLDQDETSMLEQSSFRSYYSQYGSIDSGSSSKPTTISPHDNDEGLYLYWANQLLKEKGYEPSPLKGTLGEDGDDDTESIESSISDLSIIYPRTKSWLASWFPFC